ncbi:DUF6416 domain-containing protein [Mycolicibacterium iranicum]|uniref:DUF6416 domain-containing protein n=1 Tax=Mycolicibacterium iranicum TaxID=912594 RepID=UPI0009ECC9AA|nr:DUF6416 domain-containing protein [Mycolicibacterium iranicum]
MIDVTVKVPEDRVPEFYTMYGNWLNGSPSGPTPTVTKNSENPNDRPRWTDADTALAAEVWNKLSATAKGLFSTLIDEPETRFSGEELAGMLNIPNGKHGVAGVLAWPGRYCVSANRRWFWEWDYPEGETAVYWLSRENAALFREARDR